MILLRMYKAGGWGLRSCKEAFAYGLKLGNISTRIKITMVHFMISTQQILACSREILVTDKKITLLIARST